MFLMRIPLLLGVLVAAFGFFVQPWATFFGRSLTGYTLVQFILNNELRTPVEKNYALLLIPVAIVAAAITAIFPMRRVPIATWGITALIGILSLYAFYTICGSAAMPNSPDFNTGGWVSLTGVGIIVVVSIAGAAEGIDANNAQQESNPS